VIMGLKSDCESYGDDVEDISVDEPRNRNYSLIFRLFFHIEALQWVKNSGLPQHKASKQHVK
jgi:hypothetical protein